VFCLAPIWTLTKALPALHDLGMRRLVCFSSTSRFTKAASASPEERTVAEALASGEADVEAFCRTHGVSCTILRPTLIYAEGQDGNVSRLAGLIHRFGFLPLPPGPGGLRQPVHAEDLASAALAAMTSPAAVNQAYDLPGGETLSYRAMVERIFEGLGRTPRIVSLPPALLRLGYALGRRWLPGSTAEMIGRIEADLTFDAEPARRDLGWAPRDFHPRF
jgi:nucleoside-diphosphate-sugar epimerase